MLRHPASLRYVIDTVPPVPEVLQFVVRHAGLDTTEAYGTFNMGAGFALFVAPDDAARCVEVARACGIEAWQAGRVEAGPKSLRVEPIGLRFDADALQLR